MNQSKPEFIPADKSLRKNCLILIALYILLLTWLEPIIDYILALAPWDGSQESIIALNERKVYIVTNAFGVARSLPIMVFFWLGFKINQAQRLPPQGMRLPLKVILIEGSKARMLGITLMVVAMLLLLREISMLVIS